MSPWVQRGVHRTVQASAGHRHRTHVDDGHERHDRGVLGERGAHDRLDAFGVLSRRVPPDPPAVPPPVVGGPHLDPVPVAQAGDEPVHHMGTRPRPGGERPQRARLSGLLFKNN